MGNDSKMEVVSVKKIYTTIIVILLIVALCGCDFHNQENDNASIHEWSANYKPQNYFEDCKPVDNAVGEQSGFNKEYYSLEFSKTIDTNTLKEENMIPDIGNFSVHSCYAQYDKSNFVFVLLEWVNEKGDTISLVAAPSPVDKIIINEKNQLEPFDSDGSVLSPIFTVTSRDDILIYADGLEKEVKRITYQNDTGWFQFEGSQGTDYKTMVDYLDWFWEHPLDLAIFNSAIKNQQRDNISNAGIGE